MGEVYLAEDSRLRRKVALKVLPESIAADKQRLLRFEREAHSVSALNHPNILTIHEFGAQGATYYLASEFVQGETLRARLRRQRLTLPETVDIIVQIASALQAAHEAGIIHRDIKPDNVMIREDGYVKVLDFGLAKLSEPPATSSEPQAGDPDAETRTQLQTQAGMIMGTVAYMSPEQARGKLVDARTDIFSLGAVLYEMLAGRQAFTGETISHTIVAVLETQPVPLSETGEHFPAEVESIVKNTLAKNPDERYQTARALLADLKNLQRRLVVEAELERSATANSDVELETKFISAAEQNEPDLNSKPVAKELSANTSLSHYRIVSKIGAGAMGEVFCATDTRLKRKVALKLLPREFTSDKQRLLRFEQEAQTASALNHPNIITIYEIGAENSLNFIATEFIEGQTLRRKMREGLLPLNETLEIAQQVTSALVAAHQAGIVHRDIKPENIMVRPDGLAKVLDFGLAKLSASNTASVDNEANTVALRLTKPGIILGTTHYMSPEQVRGLPLDSRSDIFSLGAVLYEMLSGVGPFDRPTKSDVLAAILSDTPQPLAQVQPGVPPELQRIVAKSLRKDKEDRYQTGKDLLVDIKSLTRELEFSAKVGRTNEMSAQLAGPITARRFSLVQALAIVLVAILGISAVWWFATKRNARTGTSSPSSLKTVDVFSWRSAPGEVYSIGSFSPDGMRVALVSTTNGTRNIQVKQTSANAPPVQTTKDEFINDHPIWSPDGEEIAFFSTRGHQPGIWRIPYLGGSPALIKTLEDGDARPRYWSKAGMLYYEARQNFFAFEMKSGQTTRLTNFDATTTSANSFSISPDEKQIAYITSAGESWSVWTIPVGGGAPRQITSGAAALRNTVWHPDSQRLLYSSLVDGVYQIFVTDINSAKPVQITFGDKNSLALDVSADGAKILYGSSNEESDIWGVSVAKGEEFALTSDINSELWPNVSPDGKTVAFQSIRNLSQGDRLFSSAILTRQANADTPPGQLVANGFLPTWSPDGKRLAFMRVIGEAPNLWTIKAGGGEEKQLTTGGLSPIANSVLPYNRAQTSDFSWSPDSARIAYITHRGGMRNVWLVSADGSSDTQLTNNSDANLVLQSPLWSSDGKWIAYTAKLNQLVDGKLTYGLWVVNVETRESKLVLQSETFLRLLGWSENEKGLIIATVKLKTPPSLTDVSVAEASVAAGVLRPITTQPATYINNIHLSADRRAIAYVAHREGKDNIWIIPAARGTARMITANRDTRLYFSSLAWAPDGGSIFFGKQSRYSLLSMITNFN